MDLSKRSASWQLSMYDVVSWAKNTWFVVVFAVIGELLMILPKLQEIGTAFLIEHLGGSEITNSFIITLMASIGLLVKKWLTNYKK